MRKSILVAFALMTAGLLCIGQSKALTQQELILLFGNRAALAGIPPSYQGPGDVVSGAFAWWGLRCYATAYTGNVADVYAPSDASHTLITCSSGGILNETLQALSVTCAISCTVKTLYDQSGNSHCTTACDFSQVTESLRPAFTLNCVSSKYCMTGVGTSAILSTPALSGALSQPFTVTTGAKRTSGTSYSPLLANDGGSVGLYYGPSAGKADVFIGADNVFNQTDGSWHRVIGIFNGASSSGSIDGSTSALAGAASTGISTVSLKLFNDQGGDSLIGTQAEIGLWSFAFSGGQITSIDSNISAYWGI